MSGVAIYAEELSKRFRIVARHQAYKTLRDNIGDIALTPLRSLGKLVRRSDAADGGWNGEIVWALREVSFEVKHGEAMAIIGRNGAGKSTLLKILSRIMEPTSGRAVVEGRVGSLLEVGTGFHQELTGRENIYLNGAVLGMRRADISRRFDEIVDFADVEQYLDTPVKYYSTGMYMRLAFAVAAHLEPEVLIVDEVLAVGDAEFQRKCLGKMGQVAGEGRTVLFVSHNMAAVSEICRSALLLEKGRVVARGATPEVIAQYLVGGRVSDGVTQVGEHDGWRESGEFRFCSVAVRNPGEEPNGQVQRGEGIEVVIEYEVTKPIRSCHIGLDLWNDAGVCVLTSGCHDRDPFSIEVEQPGRRAICCRIPADYLRAGVYSVSLLARVPNVRYFAGVPHALSFEVVDLNSAAAVLQEARAGIMHPELDWVWLEARSHTVDA
jgi:lipopolysaccharide transport system ATP-binding protein